MTTMMMPTTAQRVQSTPTKEVGHLAPLLLALALLTAMAVISVLVTGPMP